MKTVALASFLSLAASLASAAKFNAVCVFDELKCGGTIQLREYTPDTTGKCDSGSCAALTAPGATTFSTLPTCTDDHVVDTEKHLKSKPYVLVESYAASGCTGTFTSAVAVVASGKCFPSSKGDMSYKVTLGATDLSVMWMQYADASCATNATEVSFLANETDGKMCVKDTMKVLAINPNMAKTSMPMDGTTPAPTTSGAASTVGTYTTLTAAVVLTVAAAIVA